MNPQLTVMTLIRGGVFTRADARACGYLDPDIDSLLDSGAWRRVRPGTYAPGRRLAVVNEEMLHLRRLYHLLRYGEPRLAASHQSAAALHALPLWGLDLSMVHVTALKGRAGLHPGRVHRHVREPVGPGIQYWNGVRLVSPARAVAEVAATAPLEPAVVLADAALYSGMITAGTLRRAISRLAARPSEVERARRVLSRAGSQSASVGESRVRLMLAEAGLPAPSLLIPLPAPECDDGVETSALWFQEERTVVEVQSGPRFRRDQEDEYDSVPEWVSRSSPRSHTWDPPAPLEHCWISWPDLDDPDLVVDRVRAAFSRARAQTGVRAFDASRRRPTSRRRRSLLPAGSYDGDLPC